ncbi:MAG: hypothetical protein ACREA1_03920 [Nitrosotalea sp.]
MKTLHLSIMIIVSVLVMVTSSDWVHAQLPSGNLALRLISISKSNFADGEIIPIRGHTLPNSTVNISLSDNLGNLENSTQVSSDNTGYFYTNLGIPSHVIGGGSWHIFAKSHNDYNSIQIQVNTHGVVTMPDNFPSGLSPLKQFRLGIPTDAIQCHTSFQLVLNAEDGHPACVKPDTAQKLIERGWADNMTDNADNETIKQTVNHKFPHPPDGFGCGMWSNATGWVKGNCVSPNIPHP